MDMDADLGGREKAREGKGGRHAKVSECGGASCGGGRPVGRSVRGGQALAVKQAVAHVRRYAYVRVIKKVGG